MERAIELAQLGMGYTSPNPMVGAVIVDKKGEIVGEGYHQKVGTAHAEIHALNEAGILTKGSTLYVNLEPCAHYGRTPPCTEAIIRAGINQVVVAMEDPNPLVGGKGIAYLEQHGIKVVKGICQSQAQYLNRAFCKYITQKKPYFTLKAAMTLDGKIATKTGDSKWITGEDSRARVHLLRHEVDAIMVGIGTVLLDNPSLTTRLVDRSGKNPIRLVLDSNLRVPLDSNVVRYQDLATTIIFTTNNSDDQNKRTKRAALEDLGVLVIEAPANESGINLEWVSEWLGKKQISHVLIEGGSQINYSAIERDIVDEVWFFYAPIIFGGSTALSSITGTGVKSISEAYRFTNISIEKTGEDILIKGTRQRGDGHCSQG